MTLAYIALGSNLGGRLAAIDEAAERIDALEGVAALRLSPVYETPPVGVEDGAGAFLNAVLECDTRLPARDLLNALLSIELEMGRVRRGDKPSSRIIDLDLLLYGDSIIDEPGLEVPHPRMHVRRFALQPLADLAPGLVLPGDGRRVSDCLASLPDEDGFSLARAGRAWKREEKP